MSRPMQPILQFNHCNSRSFQYDNFPLFWHCEIDDKMNEQSLQTVSAAKDHGKTT